MLYTHITLDFFIFIFSFYIFCRCLKWSLSANELVASLHIDCVDSRSFDEILSDVRAIFIRSGISNVTVTTDFDFF